MSLQVVFDMGFTWSYVRGSKADLRNIKASWSWFGSDTFAFVSPQKTKSSQRPLGLFKEYKFMIHDGSYLRISPCIPIFDFWNQTDYTPLDSRPGPWPLRLGLPENVGGGQSDQGKSGFDELFMCCLPPLIQGTTIWSCTYKSWSCNATYGHLCAHVYHHSRKSCPVIWNDRWHTAYWQEGVSLYGYPLTFIQIADTSCRASCHVQTYPIPQRNIPQTSNS